jgi:hypothetical protein
VQATGRLAAACAALLCAGCSGVALQTAPHGRFAALTTRTGPALGYQIEGAPRTVGVEAVVLSQHFLWIPTRTDPPTLAEAVEEALYRGNGDLLVDVEVDRLFFSVPLIYGQEGWRVRGDVVRTRRPEDPSSSPDPSLPDRPGSQPPSAIPGATP